MDQKGSEFSDYSKFREFDKFLKHIIIKYLPLKGFETWTPNKRRGCYVSTGERQINPKFAECSGKIIGKNSNG